MRFYNLCNKGSSLDTSNHPPKCNLLQRHLDHSKPKPNISRPQNFHDCTFYGQNLPMLDAIPASIPDRTSSKVVNEISFPRG